MFIFGGDKVAAAGLLQEVLREIFLDNHLDGPAVIASTTPELMVENLGEADLTLDQAAAIIAHATSVLTDEEKSDRDEIVSRRLQAEAEEAERERLEALEAARAAVGEESEAGQSASPAQGPA